MSTADAVTKARVQTKKAGGSAAASRWQLGMAPRMTSTKRVNPAALSVRMARSDSFLVLKTCSKVVASVRRQL